MEKQLYPKTRRYKKSNISITEKLDGSNLGIFKINDKLLIAQRNHIYFEDELTFVNSYKGLKNWLNENGEHLKSELFEGSGVFGEWIGMGQIKYHNTNLDKKFYIFAKANINDKFEIRNLVYERELFIYPFIPKQIPNYIDIVPLIFDNTAILTIDFLNDLYKNYCEEVNRKVEGFIINMNNNIQKYIRYKNGKFEEHQAKGD